MATPGLSDDPVLTADRLTVARGRRVILRDVDLTVAPGEIVAVLGPNGAGKSTLLGTLIGLHRPAGGRVTRRGRVASILQEPGLARRTAGANVRLALAWWGVPRGERATRATAALELMRADHLQRRPARSLSGGERRRIHLARAVAVSPDVLLLDEPFDGLDPLAHDALRTDAVHALRSVGSAVVIVLHDRHDAWAVADRIVVLLDGRVAADGPPPHLLADPPSAEVARFLGYDGELDTAGGGRLLTRSAQVRPDPDGDVTGIVEQRQPVEDGVRLLVRTGRGSVWARAPLGGIGADTVIGDELILRIDGGVEFDAGPPSTT